MSSLLDKAKTAYFALKSKLPYSENLSVKTWLQLFNSMITPILTYGSEVWISEFKPNFEALDKSKLEKTQNSIFKNILGVHGKSSNLAVRCELGTLPISIKCYQLMFKYYERLSNIGERSGGPHEILKAAFEVDKTLTNKENSWSYKLSELMKYIGISFNKHCNINFKQKLEDFYKNKIIFELSKIKDGNCGKLLFFSKIYTKFKQQEYLNFNIPKYLRKKLTKLRISAHSLAIETGRYARPKIPSNERFCKFCTGKIENEIHILIECPQYNKFRSNIKLMI